jgi:hypothetical protein
VVRHWHTLHLKLCLLTPVLRYVKHAIQNPLSQQALDAAKELPLASFANLMGDNATALALTCSVAVCGLLHMYAPTLSVTAIL